MPGYVRKLGQRKDGSTAWQARWRNPTNPAQRIEKSFRTRALADRWLKKQDTTAYEGSWLDPRRGDRPFREVADAWRGSWLNLEPKTRAGYESILTYHLLPEFSDTRTSAITTAAVEAYVARLLADGASPTTVRSIHAALRRALNTAVRLRMIASNPAVGVVLPRATKRSAVFLDPAEIRALAEAHPEPYRALVWTAAYTGLRAGELGALRRRDLDLLHRRLTVNRALKDLTGARLPEPERRLTFGPTKTHQARQVILPPFLVQVLEAHLRDHPGPNPNDPDALVFTTPDGAPIRQTNFYRRHFRPAVKATLPLSKQTTRFHDLRHSHAALLIATGAHPKAVQERMGHSTITMTLDLYGHLMPGLAERAADALEALANPGAQPEQESVRAI